MNGDHGGISVENVRLEPRRNYRHLEEQSSFKSALLRGCLERCERIVVCDRFGQGQSAIVGIAMLAADQAHFYCAGCFRPGCCVGGIRNGATLLSTVR